VAAFLRVEEYGPVVFFRLTRTILSRPLRWAGAYLVDGLLLDCGPPATARELLQALEGRAVDGLAITHHHEDHMGSARLLASHRGLVPRLHRAGVPLLRDGFRQELYRRLVWGRPARVAAEPLDADVRGRSTVLQVVHTPGHSPDHVCFFAPDDGWLFTGDLFLAERLRFLRSDEDLSALIRSLRTVAQLPVRAVFCAHRGLVPDGPAALRRKAEHLAGMREKIRELLARGLPEREVARRAVGREGSLTWFSLGQFSAVNFVRAVRREGG
jgi:glyoxylase-like metal-dependent hydrolase (beta-lactamase superfamily II)